MTDSWYKDAIRAKWDIPEVREAILNLLFHLNDDPYDAAGEDLESR